MKDYDILVFIGRFQPLHIGHEAVINYALERAERVVILVGSSNRARSPRNPWTFDERHEMIRLTFHWEVENKKLEIFPLPDYLYNDNAWLTKVRDIISFSEEHAVGRSKTAIIGYQKDRSTYYLGMLCDYEVVAWDKQPTFNSTEIRDDYFRFSPRLPEICNKVVKNFMVDFWDTVHYEWLVREHQFNYEYKRSWKIAPYPPTIMTVDPVVIQNGHVLLVTRGEFPGKGLLAFPGGHVDQDEFLIDAVVRELKEETAIADSKGSIPPAILKSFITKRETFDDPHRSERGRVITHAYLFELPTSAFGLYPVKGGSDARMATWYPISDIKGPMMFEDHFFIMTKMLGLTIE